MDVLCVMGWVVFGMVDKKICHKNLEEAKWS